MKEEFILTWDKDFEANGYIVMHQIKDKFVELVRIENTNLTAIMLPSIKKGTENHFRVSFYGKRDNDYCIYRDEDYYCFITSKGLIVYRLPIPKLKKAIKKADSIIIEWEKVSDKVTYVVARKVPKGVWTRIGMTKETMYVDSKIDITKKYIYTVRCVSDDGKTNLSSCSIQGICV